MEHLGQTTAHASDVGKLPVPFDQSLLHSVVPRAVDASSL